jgi:hypothetical protein
MRRPHDISSYEVHVLETSETNCGSCRTDLWVTQHRERALQTLKRKLWVVSKDKACPLEECPEVGRILRPEGEGALPLLYQSEYGLDVVVRLGEMRETEDMTFSESHRTLVDQYGIEISERHVSNLYRVYLSLVHCVNADFEPLRAKLRRQGRLVLSVDGVQFDGVAPVLYVVREILSSEVLYSERVEKRDATHLEALLVKVKALGIPVTGIVSDKEKGLVPAVERAFPGVSHQYCQSHYLGNLRKPMDEDVALLGNGVSKVVCAVKGFARKVKEIEEGQAASETTLPKYATSDVTAEEMKLVNELCCAALAGGKAGGDPILGPAPVKRFERLNKVKHVAERAAQRTGGEWKLLGALITVLSLLTEHADLAARLLRQVDIVRKVAHILNFKTTGRQVRRMLRTYLNSLVRETSEGQADTHVASFAQHVNAVSNRYWKGLFHCYDNKDIPRTDNALEQMFSLFKRHLRRITGRKSTAGGPLESLAAFVLEAWSTVRLRPQYAKLVHLVPPDKLLAARAKLEKIAGPARKRRSIQRDPDRHLQRVLEEWLGPDQPGNG